MIPRGHLEHQPFSLDAVVTGRSAGMRDVFEFVKVIAEGDSSVLITGESGTGKELIANLIHHSSPRRHRPFVAVSCATFAEMLIGSEPPGLERAEGGTLFLDDIDDVPLPMQAKVVRVLQKRAIERAGATYGMPLDVRVLAGSKRDLRKMVAAGEFREDLFYRLNVISIHLPPLRDRVEEDIPALAIAPTQGSLDERLQSFESQLIAAALREAHGNKSKAAALLKIKRSTLGDRIKKLGVGGVNAIAR
jgi:transcriptional regulator with PAS, ATPase and Fis domain